MRKKALFVVLDGCPVSYIKKENTPYLYSLMSKHGCRLWSSQTFASQVEIFTGLKPYRTDTFVDWFYSPETSPYRIFRPFLNNIALSKRDKTRNLILKCMTLYGGHRIDPLNIPSYLLPNFDFNRSMFSYYRSQVYRLPPHLFHTLDAYGIDPVMLHFAELDTLGHVYSPRSREVKDYMKMADHKIRQLLKKADYRLTVILSDHGMVEITDYVDLWESLSQLNLMLGRDYSVFLNSPMARFWVHTEKSRNNLINFLSELGHGHIISDKEKVERSLPQSKKFGEIIFWMDRGVHISPDFYHFKKLKGMHGYLKPEAVPFIIPGYSLKDGYLADVTPTILDALDLPIGERDGKSLIR